MTTAHRRLPILDDQDTHHVGDRRRWPRRPGLRAEARRPRRRPRHSDRPQQLPPVPAAPVPGRDLSGAPEHSFPHMRSTTPRGCVRASFEQVDRHPSLIERGAMNVVLVGGGPTGFEVAGAIGDKGVLVPAISAALMWRRSLPQGSRNEYLKRRFGSTGNRPLTGEDRWKCPHRHPHPGHTAGSHRMCMPVGLVRMPPRAPVCWVVLLADPCNPARSGATAHGRTRPSVPQG